MGYYDWSSITIPTFNWTTFRADIATNSLLAFTTVFGFFFWPIFFSGVYIYIYMKTQSMISLVAAILLTLGGVVSSNILAGVPEFVMFLQVGVSLILGGMVVVLYMKYRR